MAMSLTSKAVYSNGQREAREISKPLYIKIKLPKTITGPM